MKDVLNLNGFHPISSADLEDKLTADEKMRNVSDKYSLVRRMLSGRRLTVIMLEINFDYHMRFVPTTIEIYYKLIKSWSSLIKHKSISLHNKINFAAAISKSLNWRYYAIKPITIRPATSVPNSDNLSRDCCT